ncbi:hypothetical protein [Luteococcus sanguinis]|uniref:Uncharacterized protein n=1 Tax=Luteococcus sanguinis TaxID=174038 RepID=A0ABW1X2Y2_9ACTN
MSMMLLESEIPTWVAGLVMLLLLLGALSFVRQVGHNRPHS